MFLLRLRHSWTRGMNLRGVRVALIAAEFGGSLPEAPSMVVRRLSTWPRAKEHAAIHRENVGARAGTAISRFCSRSGAKENQSGFRRSTLR